MMQAMSGPPARASKPRPSDRVATSVTAEPSDPYGSTVTAEPSDPYGSTVTAEPSDPYGSTVAAEASHDELADTMGILQTQWRDRGIDPLTLSIEGGTVVGPRQAEEIPASVLLTLPPLLSSAPSGAGPQLQLGEKLGEGGMGIVRLAAQPALGREVAVKTVRDGANAKVAMPQLLREARVTGNLEHPNVVPVHALGRDDNDQPLIVMKRVEGDSWLALLEQTDREERKSHAYLGRHLAILLQVAHALSFAHTRGVVHRDVKPENVMIGNFGEVYLVDWGIAVSVRDDGVRGVPLARDVDSIAGTPSYLAPEMAVGAGHHIDERTDVYLLGATLHEIITGAPPHLGESLSEVLHAAFISQQPHYRSHVPAELAAICHKAMERRNAQRYQTMGDFIRAVEEFLEHRASIELTHAARKRLAQLEHAIEAAPASGLLDREPEEAEDDERAHELQSAFSECRFGFMQALRSWPDNAEARAGLRQALCLMVEYELGRDNPGGAQALLREIDDPPATLLKRLEAGLDMQRATGARLRALEHDKDLGVGAKMRALMSLGFGITWGAVLMSIGILWRNGSYVPKHLHLASFNAGFLLLTLVGLWVGRAELLANRANRRIVVVSLVAFAEHMILWLVAERLGVSVTATATLELLAGASIWGIGALAVDSNWRPLSASSFLAIGPAMLWPVYVFEVLGIAGIIGAGSSGLLMHRRAGRAATGAIE
jgi:serine/threonine-protein kinase